LKSVFRSKPLFKQRTMLTIAIIDDEQHCINRILELLEPYGDNLEIASFLTAEESIRGIEILRPAIVFLDVQLRGRTGFEVLSAITYRDFSLIFTTAHEQYAIAAFKCAAIDYLLKPIDESDFERAMRKAMEKVEQTQLAERIGILLSHLEKDNAPKRISIPYKEGYHFLDIRSIARCEADVNYTHILMADGQKYTVSKPLKHFEGLLAEHDFFRIHNSHLINLDYIKSYTKSGKVTLLDNLTLDVSVRKKESFIKTVERR